MLTFVLMRDSARSRRFWRVEVEYNLFGEYSVLRECGRCGSGGRQRLVWFSNLRDACVATDRWRRRVERRGYRTLGHTPLKG